MMSLDDMKKEYTGRQVEALATPAIVVDANALEHNLREMADFFRERRCSLRPHFKSHKCVTLARRQCDDNDAVGIGNECERI